MTLEVSVSSRVERDGLPSDALIARWAQASYRLSVHASVCVSIVDEGESAYLNEQYRQKNYPTNVLSFSLDMSMDEGFLREHMLGDVVICAAVVEAEAAEQNKSLEAHWAHMVVHGMLHLQGFDHVEEEEANEMEKHEVQVLASLGYPEPY